MYQTMAKRNQEEKKDAAKQRMVHSHVAPIIEVKKSFRYLKRNRDIIPASTFLFRCNRR